MNLLIVNDFTHIGGAEQVLLGCCRYLRSGAEDTPWAVQVVTSGPGPFADAIRGLDDVSLEYIDFNYLKRCWRKPSAWRDIGHAFRKTSDTFQPDVVLCNSIWSAVAVKRILSNQRVPVLGAVHAAPVPRRRDKKIIFRLLGGWLTRPVDGWITVSSELARQLRAIGIDGERIRVIPNGVSVPESARVERNSKWRQRYGIPESAVVFAALGRLHPGKGQHLVIEAFAAAASEYADTWLMITGEEVVSEDENLGYTDALEQTIRRCKLEDRVILTGFVNDASEIIRASDVVVSASFEESFGLSVLEGMAAGRAVVASDIPAHAALITHRNNGLLFSHDARDTLNDAFRTLINDPGLRRRLGQAAHREAARFDLPATLSRWRDFIEHIAAKRPRVPAAENEPVERRN